MIVGGQTEARASTIDYHAPFDRGFTTVFVKPAMKKKNICLQKKVKLHGLASKIKTTGESGYRSRYLPHAKRALYHLS